MAMRLFFYALGMHCLEQVMHYNIVGSGVTYNYKTW